VPYAGGEDLLRISKKLREEPRTEVEAGQREEKKKAPLRRHLATVPKNSKKNPKNSEKEKKEGVKRSTVRSHGKNQKASLSRTCLHSEGLNAQAFGA